MRHLLFNLQGVPEDEADAVRECLQQNGIDFYETTAGPWRIGLAAIWLPDAQQKDEAEAVLEQYQQQRYQGFEKEREHLKQLGVVKSIMLQFYLQPLKVGAALLGIVLVLMISILPFAL